MKRTKKIVGLSLFVLMVLSTSVSCVMDRVSLFYIKNCTKDSLLINVTRTDTLTDWHFWSREDEYVMSQNDTRVIDDVFHEAVASCLALPDSTICIAPYILQRYDSCYIYAVKYSVAKKYSMDDIRTKKFYDRQVITKKYFHDRLFEYKYVRPSGNY